jgi:trehalose 6-phosphate synthase
MWTKDALGELVKTKFSGYPLIVVSNREPYIHSYVGGEIKWTVPASGLTVALDPVMRACGGVWVAHGSGDADRQVVDAKGRLKVPPDNPEYTLKRVWLTREEESGYYFGFSNQALWPLSHIVYTRPEFDEGEWITYKKVNRLFAEAVLDEVGDEPAFVFIQDYHLTLLSRLLREANSKIITAQFWHIPWPNPEAFRICPWQDEILDGLLANDLLGFHTRYYCNNFLDTVERLIESKVDYERDEITRHGRKTLVSPFPISVDFERISRDSEMEIVIGEIDRLKMRWGLDDEFIGLGIDRLDYTKGIPDRLKALDRFLESNPQYAGRVVFFQLGDPSRTHIKKYKELSVEVDDLVEEINWRYRQANWKPIIYLKEHISPATLLAYQRMANFCVVSSLHDGMNLVAKEYVSSRSDSDGVLILSRFTGAARELTDAILVNPYAHDEFARAIKEAIEMPPQERQRRMSRMREIVQQNNIYRWAADILSEMVTFEIEGA